MMNLEETIDRFRRGMLDIDCKSITIRRNQLDSQPVRGPGYIRQDKNGRLEFKVYGSIADITARLARWDEHVRGTPGKLFTEDSFSSLTAESFDNVAWTSDRLRPIPHIDYQDGTCILTGSLDSIRASLVAGKGMGDLLPLSSLFDRQAGKYLLESCRIPHTQCARVLGKFD